MGPLSGTRQGELYTASCVACLKSTRPCRWVCGGRDSKHRSSKGDVTVLRGVWERKRGELEMVGQIFLFVG